MKKKIILILLTVSIFTNIFLLSNSSNLYVMKTIDWSYDGSIEAKGYLEALNYDAPKDWHTIFFISYDDNSIMGEQSNLMAREVIVSNGTITSLPLKTYNITTKTPTRIVASNNEYTFEITKDEVTITDKNGKRSKFSSSYIR